MMRLTTAIALSVGLCRPLLTPANEPQVAPIKKPVKPVPTLSLPTLDPDSTVTLIDRE